ncbi:MAG: hypothetical protein LBC13_03815 [Clostridiales bacterium]|jgi:aspartate aminotransferase-like enzyme|nr:hypothetical protein [Clostridiales bacterium]
MSGFTKNELEEAKRQTESMLRKLEKCLEKLKAGTAQYTLAVRRIDALRLSLALIQKELDA